MLLQLKSQIAISSKEAAIAKSSKEAATTKIAAKRLLLLKSSNLFLVFSSSILLKTKNRFLQMNTVSCFWMDGNYDGITIFNFSNYDIISMTYCVDEMMIRKIFFLKF